MSQAFWALDVDTHQPVCFPIRTASRNVGDATPELTKLAEAILQPSPCQLLVLADTEHFSSELISDIHGRTGMDLLVPMPNKRTYRQRFEQIPQQEFKTRWAGFATAKGPIDISGEKPDVYHRFVERYGERSDDWYFTGFM